MGNDNGMPLFGETELQPAAIPYGRGVSTSYPKGNRTEWTNPERSRRKTQRLAVELATGALDIVMFFASQLSMAFDENCLTIQKKRIFSIICPLIPKKLTKRTRYRTVPITPKSSTKYPIP
jgi:hypothetical protein